MGPRQGGRPGRGRRAIGNDELSGTKVEHPHAATCDPTGIYRFESCRISVMEKPSYVYILASAPYGTLYVGSTTDLIRRVWQHREGVLDGFTKQYQVGRLVWYEIHADIMEAGLREKQIKKWNRDWKVRLIEEGNPRWLDLYAQF